MKIELITMIGTWICTIICSWVVIRKMQNIKRKYDETTQNQKKSIEKYLKYFYDQLDYIDNKLNRIEGKTLSNERLKSFSQKIKSRSKNVEKEDNSKNGCEKSSSQD